MPPIVNMVHFRMHIMKAVRSEQFLAAGLVGVAIKKHLLSGVPNRAHSNTGTSILSSLVVTASGVQACGVTYQELVAAAIDCPWPACNWYSTF